MSRSPRGLSTWLKQVGDTSRWASRSAKCPPTRSTPRSRAPSPEPSPTSSSPRGTTSRSVYPCAASPSAGDEAPTRAGAVDARDPASTGAAPSRTVPSEPSGSSISAALSRWPRCPREAVRAYAAAGRLRHRGDPVAWLKQVGEHVEDGRAALRGVHRQGRHRGREHRRRSCSRPSLAEGDEVARRRAARRGGSGNRTEPHHTGPRAITGRPHARRPSPSSASRGRGRVPWARPPGPGPAADQWFDHRAALAELSSRARAGRVAASPAARALAADSGSTSRRSPARAAAGTSPATTSAGRHSPTTGRLRGRPRSSCRAAGGP